MEKKISELLSGSVDSGALVGAGCLVFKNGKELCSCFSGLADRENGLPMRRDTICRLFSLTKPVTAAAVMLLMDMGKLSPDDEVSKYFPEYKHLRFVSEYHPDGEDLLVDCTRPLLISHLLTMTSGIPYAHNWCEPVRAAARLFDEVEYDRDSGRSEITTEEFTKRAAQIPLMWEPGEKWDYGISADILGGIVERVSGMQYSEFLKKYVFDPLGMHDTGFYVPEEKRDRFAALYRFEDGGAVRDENNYLGLTDYTAPPAFESGGAGLVSTIEDYSKFARMLCNGGELDGVRIMSSEAFRFMTSPKLSSKQSVGLWDRLDGYNYACLMRVMTDEKIAQIKSANGEFGWDGWTGTYFCAEPNSGIVVLFFTQIAGGGTTWQAEQVDRIVFDELVRNK
ncbi:MAG: beta-lactamase family protein [Ruminococcus sp.]|nr:beta-lactamase family protein [Ruminococcus sp.]